MSLTEAENAIARAETIANKSWPLVWRFPVPSQADAVWAALKPAHDYIMSQTREPVERPEDESLKAPVIETRKRIAAIKTDATVKGVVQAVRGRENTPD